MPKKGKKKKEKTAGAPEEEEDDDYPELDIRPERWVNLRVRFSLASILFLAILIASRQLVINLTYDVPVPIVIHARLDVKLAGVECNYTRSYFVLTCMPSTVTLMMLVSNSGQICNLEFSYGARFRAESTQQHAS